MYIILLELLEHIRHTYNYSWENFILSVTTTDQTKQCNVQQFLKSSKIGNVYITATRHTIGHFGGEQRF